MDPGHTDEDVEAAESSGVEKRPQRLAARQQAHGLCAPSPLERAPVRLS